MGLIRCISLHLQKAGEKHVIYVSFLRADLFTFQCINGDNEMLMTGQWKVDYKGAEWRLQPFVNRLSPFPLPPSSSLTPPPLRTISNREPVHRLSYPILRCKIQSDCLLLFPSLLFFFCLRAFVFWWRLGAVLFPAFFFFSFYVIRGHRGNCQNSAFENWMKPQLLVKTLPRR